MEVSPQETFLTAGSSGTQNVVLYPEGSFANNVTLSATLLSPTTGVSTSLPLGGLVQVIPGTPASIPLSIQTSKSAGLGIIPISITASVGGTVVANSTTILDIENSTGGIILNATPKDIVLIKGGNITSQMDLLTVGNFAGKIPSFTISGLPTSVTGTFSNISSIDSNGVGSATLKIATASNATLGQTTFNVAATVNGTTKTVPFTVAIVPNTPVTDNLPPFDPSLVSNSTTIVENMKFTNSTFAPSIDIDEIGGLTKGAIHLAPQLLSESASMLGKIPNGTQAIGNNTLEMDTSKPISSIDYNLCFPMPSTLPNGTDITDVQLSFLDTNQKPPVWTQVPGQINNGQICGHVNHFSSFSLTAKPNPLKQTIKPTTKALVINSTKPLLTLDYKENVTSISTFSTPGLKAKLNYLVNGTTVDPKYKVFKHALNIDSHTGVVGVHVAIPKGIKITGNAKWNGTFNVPIAKPSGLVNPPTKVGKINTIRSTTEIGADAIPLTFDHAVRLQFDGEAGQNVGSGTGTLTEITQSCGDDTQTTNDKLPAGGSCKITSGNDLAVWTKHFTVFSTFSSVSAPAPAPAAPAPVFSGGGGGGGGGGGPIYSNGHQVSSSAPVIYKVSYDVCTADQATIVAGPATSGLGVQLRTASSGIVSANMAQDQPYKSQGVDVFVAPLAAHETYFQVNVYGIGSGDVSTTTQSVTPNGCTGTVNITALPSQTTITQAQATSTTTTTQTPNNAVVPEFGPLAAIVLAVSIASILLFTRTKLIAKSMKVGGGSLAIITISILILTVAIHPTVNVVLADSSSHLSGVGSANTNKTSQSSIAAAANAAANAKHAAAAAAIKAAADAKHAAADAATKAALANKDKADTATKTALTSLKAAQDAKATSIQQAKAAAQAAAETAKTNAAKATSASHTSKLKAASNAIKAAKNKKH
jgi:predicted secreted protein with PEFG-CTERM motif